MSPAYMLFGRQLRDALPTSLTTWEPASMSYVEKYGKPSSVWSEIRRQRELATARKNAKIIEHYDANKHPLASLSVGDSVSIQNRSGTNPLRWDRTGRFVKSDGSGKVLITPYENPPTKD